MRPTPLLLLAALLLSGCTLGEPAGAPSPPTPTRGASGGMGDEEAWRVEAAAALVNASPGRLVEVPVTLRCAAPPEAPVAARLVAARLPAGPDVEVALNESCQATAFLPLELPANATPDRHAVAVEVRVAGELVRRAPEAAVVVVLGPGIGYGLDDRASVAYTGRFADTGEVFFTNDPLLRGLPYARDATHHRAGQAPLDVVARPAPNVPDGFLALLLGMRPGESRAGVVPPEQAYGNETLLARQPREESIPRDYLLDVEPESMARATFDRHVRDTGQGDPASMREGDTFVVEQGGNAWRYLILRIDAQEVEYRFAPEEGDRFTLYPFWPDASEVVGVAERQVAFYTTPTTEPGENFTYRAGWPNMTTLVRATDDAIVLRHSPTPGLVYERPVATGGTARVEVRELTPTHVVEAYPNPHPFAGRALVFSLRMVALEVG